MSDYDIAKAQEKMTREGWMLIIREDTSRRGFIVLLASRGNTTMRGDGRSLREAIDNLHETTNPKEVN